MMSDFWRGRRVLITGHTGFKGGWLALWLESLGAHVTGLALAPDSPRGVFEAAQVGRSITSYIDDIRSADTVRTVMASCRPEVVLHLAAQALVRHSYVDPLLTYSTNVMGTANVLDAARHTGGVRAIVVVTSDKCYENREWHWGYREDDALGGYDPYSNSKGCAEMVTAAYRNSFFNPAEHARHGTGLGSARAGNVIGGGDWAVDRLIPDLLRSIESDQPALIRSPHAIRPWQHVLEPLGGYLRLAEALVADGPAFSEGWNFGPHDGDVKPVQWIAERMVSEWGDAARWTLDQNPQPHEATYLKLDCAKAHARLNWQPRWTLAHTVDAIVAWHRAQHAGADMRAVTLAQISQYENS